MREHARRSLGARSLRRGDAVRRALRARWRLLAAPLVAVVAFTATAQEQEPGGEPVDAAGFELGDESLLLAEIPSVYSASKYEQKLSEAPSAISIVTADEIQKFGYRTLGEILNSLQGIFSTNDRNYEYVAFRGFGRPGDYNTRTLVLVDGHRLNDAVYDSGAVGPEFPLDVDLIDRVEVIRGPASSVYGTNAFFGVVNVITKRGRDYEAPEVSAGIMTNTTFQTRATVGGKLESGVEFLVSGSYFQGAGDDSLYYREFDDPETNFGVAEDADDHRGYTIFGEFSFREFTLQGGHGYSKKVLPTAAYDTVFNSDDTWTVDSLSWVDLKYQHEFGEGWDFSARAFYDHYRYYGDYLYDYSETDVPDIVNNQDDTWGDRWGSELNLSHSFTSWQLSSIGFEFEHGFRLDQKNADESPSWTYLDDERTAFDWALHSQNEFHLLENLVLNAGFRYDDQDSYGGSFNPRAALIYSPFETTALKFLYGTAFRAPSVYELYYEDGEAWKPNPDLDPETIQTFEFVVEQGLGEHFRFTSSVYYSEIEDLIELTVDPADDFLVFDNRGRIDSIGGEFRLDAQWRGGLVGRVSYAVQRAEDQKTNKRISNSPMHLAKLSLIVPFYRERIFASTELEYTSRRKTPSGSHTNDFFLTNLTLLSRELPFEGLQMSAGVRNLFDIKYSDPGSPDLAQNGIRQDGRSFFGKLSYQF